MTTNPIRRALIALHTALGTWHHYPYGVHYCATCDALYDYWLGCEGCGLPPGATAALDAECAQDVEVVQP
jgi:hypothetical protein